MKLLQMDTLNWGISIPKLRENGKFHPQHVLVNIARYLRIPISAILLLIRRRFIYVIFVELSFEDSASLAMNLPISQTILRHPKKDGDTVTIF